MPPKPTIGAPATRALTTTWRSRPAPTNCYRSCAATFWDWNGTAPAPVENSSCSQAQLTYPTPELLVHLHEPGERAQLGSAEAGNPVGQHGLVGAQAAGAAPQTCCASAPTRPWC